MTHPIVLFDGVCNLCNGAVDFIIRRDRRRMLRFAPLQGDTAARRLREAGLRSPYPDSIVLIEQERVYVRSDAVIRVARHLGFPWSLAVIVSAIPRSWRDAVYRLVASRRYRWFGRREHCRVPTGDEIDRFLS